MDHLKPHLAKLGISKLTDIQKECIQLLILSSEDLYVVLPTGTGKSILFQLAPFIQDNTGTVSKTTAYVGLGLTGFSKAWSATRMM